MPERYDFSNLSPIEFESLCIDLVAAETGLRFERFSEGADGGIDGRHSTAEGDIVLQAKHYKGSTWADLQSTVRREKPNLVALNPREYFLLTSQPLTPPRKDKLVALLDHRAVTTANIWGRTELNAYLAKHAEVEKRNIKLWLSSAAVLERLLKNDIAVFTEATYAEIERILKVFVVNPSLRRSADILKATHCLIVSGPPGVGKTTLAQVLAAEYSDEGWELVSISSIEEGYRAFQRKRQQVFIFDDFLGKIRLDPASLARDDGRIMGFLSLVNKDDDKRFILTTRSYILQAARMLSETLDDEKIEMSEMVLNLATYTRELRARILYNHLYFSEIDKSAVRALLDGDTVRKIVDHRNYMPRIIQWMTDEFRHRDVPAAEYPKLFIEALDRPDRIWDKAFKQHISSRARILLYCMYFSEQESFPDPGIRVERLSRFFERAVADFGAVTKEELRGGIFAETLRELKSSFIVVDGDRTNFINPSVQDYLARVTTDTVVVATLARCTPTLETAITFWKRIEGRIPEKDSADVAKTLLNSMISGQITGRLSLIKLAEFVGDLVLSSGEIRYCEALRRQGLDQLFWTNEWDLPTLIDALSLGKYSHLKYAPAYARYLRLEIFRALSTAREEVMELEDLAQLASNLASSSVEMSEAFFNHFDEAVEEAVDVLDVDRISRDDDPEEVIGQWLEHIRKIEGLTSTSVSYSKKSDFEERLAALQQEEYYHQRMEEELSTSSRSIEASERSTGARPFSNADIQSMFSSLKRNN